MPIWTSNTPGDKPPGLKPGRKITKDGWIVVPAPDPVQTKGIQCGVCGMQFEHGKAYGYVCSNLNCPIFPVVTYSTSTIT